MQSPDLKTRNFWSTGLVARLYRKFAGKHFNKVHAFLAEAIVNDGASSILDVACGPGDFLSYLKQRDPSIQIAGTDIAPGMIAHAKKRLGKEAAIIEANAQHQPFESKSFDVVTIMMAFHHLPDQLASLKEIRRVLRPDGDCFVVDFMARSKAGKKFWNFLEKLTGVRGHVQHYTEHDLGRLSEEAGFKTFQCGYIPDVSKRYKVCHLTV